MTFYLREGLKGMLFPSEVFLFMFLPFVLAIYYLVLRKHTKGKNIFLLVMSLLFYAYGEPKYVFLMLFMILFHYFLGLCIEKYHSKWILVFMAIADICVLGYFKYLNFIVSIFTGNLNTFRLLFLLVYLFIHSKPFRMLWTFIEVRVRYRQIS